MDSRGSGTSGKGLPLDFGPREGGREQRPEGGEGGSHPDDCGKSIQAEGTANTEVCPANRRRIERGRSTVGAEEEEQWGRGTAGPGGAGEGTAGPQLWRPPNIPLLQLFLTYYEVY